MAHIFEVFKKVSLVIVAHVVTKVSLVNVAHEKSDRPYLCTDITEPGIKLAAFGTYFVYCGVSREINDEVWLGQYC